MHDISILIMKHSKHGRKHPLLYPKVTTRPNEDPQHSVSPTLGTFERKYRNLLSLVNVEEQLEVLSTLTQYYDLPLRCFTFQDFQHAPTLEEYDRLIGMACHESPPYLFGGHYPSWATVARLFKVRKLVVVKLKKNQNGVEGILEVVFEARLEQLQKEGDWLTFMDIYGLLVYGIILFPHIECYVDLATIDAFLGKRDKGEHPVVAVLANTYYTLDYCSRKKGKGLRCCTLLLFLWLTVHLFHSSKKTKCLVEDHYWSFVKPLTKSEWTAHLDEATERTIYWYPQWNEREEVIIRCGGFPNIPLMGTQGAINYNLELAL
ncbi:hypothetical protein CR513_47583, partial [Mucuna pruriens]